MAEEYLNANEERVIKVLNNTKNEQIDKFLDYLLDVLPEEGEADIIISSLVQGIGSDINDESDEEIVEMFLYELVSLLANIDTIKSVYVFDVKLIGLEKYIYRRIEVPSMFLLADLAYAVLGTMNALGYHYFNIDFDDDIYSCTYSDPEDSPYGDQFKYAHEYPLADFGFEKDERMVLNYDFGDYFRFEITFLRSRVTNHLQSAKFMRVISSKGSGIWEDHHRLLDLYYDDRVAYNRYIKENDIDDSDFKIDLKESTSKVIKESFLQDYLYIRNMYEGE